MCNTELSANFLNMILPSMVNIALLSDNLTDNTNRHNNNKNNKIVTVKNLGLIVIAPILSPTVYTTIGHDIIFFRSFGW